MFKKLLSIFTLLVVLCMGTTARAEKILQRIDVSTAQEFVDALKVTYLDDKYGPLAGADIHLLNDIDFSETKSDGTHIVFDGDYVFQGVWHGKITGAGVDENGNVTVYSLLNLNYTLFWKLDGVEINELIIANGTFTGRDTKSGMLADHCINTTLEGVMFCNISAVGDQSTCDCDRMGSAIGYAENSTFRNLFFTYCRLITDGQYIGHVAGYAEGCTFDTCIADERSEMWADGNSDEGFGSNAYAGGICGYAKNCTITQCVNLSTVTAEDDRIGGILGYGDNTTVSDCRNGGIVKHCGKEGFGSDTRASFQTGLLITTASLIVISACAISVANNYLSLDEKANFSTIREGWFDLYRNINGCPAPEARQIAIMKSVWSKTRTSAFNTMGVISSAVQIIAVFAPEFLPIITAGFFLAYNILAIYNLACDPDEMGGIVGTAENGCQVLRCVNHGPVLCNDDDCGGIVGQLNGSTVADCYNRSFVRGKTDVAGIVGYVIDGTVKNCLNVGSVTCSQQSGYYGITGEESGSNTISGNFYLAGEYQNHNTCYSITQDQLASGWVAKQLNDARIAAGDTAMWRQNLGGEDGDFYPCYADATKPIVKNTVTDYSLVQKIYNAGDFYLAVNNPNAQISLQDDIDISNLGVLLSTYENPFRGTIQGNGHALRGFHYESTSEDFTATGTEAGNHTPHDIALFPFATGAKFENLIIDNFHLYQKDETNISVKREALLVGTADYCEFKGITVRNSSILRNSDNDDKWDVAGLVAVAKNTQKDNGKNSSFADCKIESSCKFEGHLDWMSATNTDVGGLVSRAYSTLFVRCHNAGEIWADDDNEGGICAYAEGCGFWNCLNSGKVTGQDVVGGIVGRALSCEIKESVNTGKVGGDDANNKYLGGIVGNIDGYSSVKYCLGFGEVNNAGDYCGGIEGKGYLVENVDCANNHWYYYHNSTLQTDFKAENTSFGYTKEDLYSGKFAYEYKNADGNRYLYQSLDNDPYFTDLPVPLAAAGEVYRDYFCFRTNSLEYHYSNIYQSHSANGHSTQAKADIARWGFCSTCGNIPTGATVPTAITINDADDLVTLSKGVRCGVNYQNTTFNLLKDIDMDLVDDFVPIGISIQRPFRGTFNGNGHRIKNLYIKRTSGATGVGLFGVVTGNTTIKGVTMDSSCSVDGGSSLGVGGLVGCMMTGSTSDSGDLGIFSCGNEATIKGGENTAGIIGGVYDWANKNVFGDDNSCKLTIEACYNTGSISGTKTCGALVGYGHFWVSAKNCFNIGPVSGYIQNRSMIHFNQEKASYLDFRKLYQLETLPADENSTTVSAYQFFLGDVFDRLISRNPVGNYNWSQNIGTDIVPVPSSNNSVYHKRNMSNSWGTAILPFEVLSNDSVQLYAIESTNLDVSKPYIKLSPIDYVLENTPFVFKKLDAASTSVTFDIATNRHVYLPADNAYSVTLATDVPGWSLTGTYGGEYDLTGVYFMAQDKLWFADDAIEVPWFRSYLKYDATAVSQPACLRIVVDEEGESTQIGEIRDGELHFYDDGKYLEKGRVVIRKGGKTYGAQGQLLKY